ncbi:hypothetical protein DFH08DRAFT_821969 [Mycena albidolilacea]|uniref:Uncharacterized protein n=1 Tax=Mycena albidolilacea TaxID=1033008 RepID=A0AAD6ZA16_9AGAR|nr:hypothetical protein DFH08DRAFT_821969 [Mycena albidolilacea]
MAGDDEKDDRDRDGLRGRPRETGYTVGYTGRPTSRALTRMQEFDLLQPPLQWRAAHPHAPEMPMQEQVLVASSNREKGKAKELATAKDTFSLRSWSTATGTGTAIGTIPADAELRRQVHRDKGLAISSCPSRCPRPFLDLSRDHRQQAQTHSPTTDTAPTAVDLRVRVWHHGCGTQSAVDGGSAACETRVVDVDIRGFYERDLSPPDGPQSTELRFLVHQAALEQVVLSRSSRLWVFLTLFCAFGQPADEFLQSNSASGPSTGLVTDAALLAADNTLQVVGPEPQLRPDASILPRARPCSGVAFLPGFVPLSPIAIVLGLRSMGPQPPAYSLHHQSLQDACAPTLSMGSSMHSEMDSASATVIMSTGLALGQPLSIPVATRSGVWDQVLGLIVRATNSQAGWMIKFEGYSG